MSNEPINQSKNIEITLTSFNKQKYGGLFSGLKLKNTITN